MNILLDTHTFLWYLQDSNQLSYKAAELLEDSSNRLGGQTISINIQSGQISRICPPYFLKSEMHFLVRYFMGDAIAQARKRITRNYELTFQSF